MKPVFRIGDPVEILITGKYHGVKGTICEIKDNPDTFEQDWVYVIEGVPGYSYHYHLKLDIAEIRDNKINKILGNETR